MTIALHTPRLERVGELLGRVDHWHIDGVTQRQDVGSKEWQHFCVFTPELDLLINFSLMDGIQTGTDPAERTARVSVLARRDGGWTGGVERVAPQDLTVRAGAVDGRFGRSRIGFSGGVYRVTVKMESCDVSAELEFEPCVTPAITDPQPLGRGGTMRWLVVPRLRASGEVRIGEWRTRLRAAPAYHDHDWGVFRWGEGFSWNWAVAMPDDEHNPWVMAATQIGDERRTRRFANSFLLWRKDRLSRAIRGPGITTRTYGLLRPDYRPLRIPAIMALASPGQDIDIPLRYEVRAEEQGDVVELSIELEDYAQIAIPNDAESWGTTLLSECCGRAHAEGIVRGERLEMDGPALLELVHVRP